MTPLRSVNDLETWRQDLARQAAARTVVRVCSTGCRALRALDVCAALEREVEARGLGQQVRVVRAGCHGLCAGAVTLVIDPQGLFYQKVKPEDAAEIVQETILEGKTIQRLCWSRDGQVCARQNDIPFYKHQTRLVLRNCGRIDPANLEDAIAAGAYVSAARVLTGMTPEQVVAEVTAAGLRGRGGAGFPTGRKWQLVREAAGSTKYLVCNADEGDPGAFMDRAVLEGDPHLVLEGMLIGAYAIGSTQGYVYVRAEYPIAIEQTQKAIAQARAAGLLGQNILGTGVDFDLDIRQGAGAFVCGEETALIASIEGHRGMPRPRPPFPATSGLFGQPTNINNVETWANMPRLFEMGAAAYAAIGTAGSKGTKIFALAGKVNHTGLVEVPMGATLRQIIFDIGGGIPGGKSFKAAQMGGPSGGCVPAQYLDLPIDYDSLKDIGAIMGSGGLIVMDEGTCMVDIARFFTEFVQSESCGKCPPCRVGTLRMWEALTRITQGAGAMDDLVQLEALGRTVKAASLCGLGQTAPNPVLSTLRHFRSEYEAHVRDRRCPAAACKKLIAYTIEPERCKGCGLCAKKCPVDAIVGVLKGPHRIIQEKCIRCGVCQEVCKFDAVLVG